MNGDKLNYETARTVLVITTGFIVLYTITNWGWARDLALVVGFLGILSTTLANWISFIWIKITVLLSHIVPSVILTIVYFLVLTPFSLLSRVFKKDQLFLKNHSNTLFVEKNYTYKKSSFENPW